jgi:hypothetical protein
MGRFEMNSRKPSTLEVAVNRVVNQRFPVDLTGAQTRTRCLLRQIIRNASGEQSNASFPPHLFEVMTSHLYRAEEGPGNVNVGSFGLRQGIHSGERPQSPDQLSARLSNDLWVREVRQRSESGAQSSILSTDYRSDLSCVAAAMFARWCQENFSSYMRQHSAWPSTASNLFLIQPGSLTRLGVSSIVRSGVKTDCSAVNWSNLPRSSCPRT